MAVSRPSPRPFRPTSGPSLAAIAAGAAFLALAAVPRPAFAEESFESPLKPGAWAVGFDWITDSGFYGVGSSRAVGLTVKRQRSERAAFRLGIGTDYEESQQDGIETRSDSYAYPPDPPEIGVTGNTENHAYFVSLQWVGYRPVRDRVSVFVAVGPSFGYGFSRTSNVHSSTNEFRQDVYTSVRRSASLLGHIGFEWFFTKRLSLAGQVATLAAYEWGSNDNTYSQEYVNPAGSYEDHQRTTMKGVRFRTGRAAFMVGAYF